MAGSTFASSQLQSRASGSYIIVERASSPTFEHTIQPVGSGSCKEQGGGTGLDGITNGPSAARGDASDHTAAVASMRIHLVVSKRCSVISCSRRPWPNHPLDAEVYQGPRPNAGMEKPATADHLTRPFVFPSFHCSIVLLPSHAVSLRPVSTTFFFSCFPPL